MICTTAKKLFLFGLFFSTLGNIVLYAHELPKGHRIVRYRKNAHQSFVKIHLKRYEKQLRLKKVFGTDHINKAIAFIEKPNTETLIYRTNNNQHVGFITYSITPRRTLWNKVNVSFLLGNKATIHFLCISSENHNKGFGASLLEAVLNKLKVNNSVKYVTAHTRYCDIIARYLFEKMGFIDKKQISTVSYTYYFNRVDYSYDKDDDYEDLKKYLLSDDQEDDSWANDFYSQQINHTPEQPVCTSYPEPKKTQENFENTASTNTETTMKLGQVDVPFDDTEIASEKNDNYIPPVDSWENWWLDDGHGPYKLSDYC